MVDGAGEGDGRLCCIPYLCMKESEIRGTMVPDTPSATLDLRQARDGALGSTRGHQPRLNEGGARLEDGGDGFCALGFSTNIPLQPSAYSKYSVFGT